MKTHNESVLQPRRWARPALPFLCAGALFLSANPEPATAAIAGVSQITQTAFPAFAVEPSVNAAGDRIAFVSNDDLVPGGNPDGSPEIFLFATGSGFKQITNSVDGSSSEPSISADGSRIAFRSTADLVPGGNPDGNSEIFLAIKRFHNLFRLVQITHSLGGSGITNSQPSLSADGGRIAFASKADFVPGDNLDRSTEIFLAQGSEILQLTHNDDPTTFCLEPSINSDGSRIAFTCTADLIPGGNTERHPALFLVTQGQGLTQITPGSATAALSSPSISADGLRIAFQTSADLVRGGNLIAPQIFLHSVGEGFTQISSGALGGLRPSISADGSRIAFVSGVQLFISLGSGTPAPVTPAAADGRFGIPSLSGNGVVIAFESAGDHVPGGNTDRNVDLFLARLHVGPTVGTSAAGSE